MAQSSDPADPGQHGDERSGASARHGDAHHAPDGRGQVPGEHPTVARSGRSQSTAIAFAAALVGAALLYIAIAAGISLPGL
jgi:hypothetical protein